MDTIKRIATKKVSLVWFFILWFALQLLWLLSLLWGRGVIVGAVVVGLIALAVAVVWRDREVNH